ncbi:MAG: tetratricopeptide repeat protein [Saprospiraceae bacterium]
MAKDKQSPLVTIITGVASTVLAALILYFIGIKSSGEPIKLDDANNQGELITGETPAKEKDVYKTSPVYRTEKIEPNLEPLEYYRIGYSKFEADDFNNAIQYFSKAITDSSTYSLAYCMRGFSKRHLEDYSGAIKDYSIAIQLNPKSYYYYNNRAVVKFFLEDYESVIKDCTKSIELFPNNSHPFNNRANAYYMLGKYDQAKDDYQRAIDLEPNYTDALKGLGDCLLYFGEKDKACEYWKKGKFLGDKACKELWEKHCTEEK